MVEKQRKTASTTVNDREITVKPLSRFFSNFEFGTADRLWEDVNITNGSVNHLPDKSGKELKVQTSSGDKVIRQSRRYLRYIPGYQIEYAFAFKLPQKTDGLRCRIGAFDSDNGIFIEQDGQNISIVRRSKATGSVQNDKVAQTNWDSFSPVGTTYSHNFAETLDLTQVQMLTISLLWYGGGAIEVEWQIGDTPLMTKVFQGANKRTEPIMGPPSLPIRAEIENTSSQSSSHTMELFGTKGELMGDESFSTDPFSVDSGNSLTTTSGETAILAIRPKLTVNGIENRVRILVNLVRGLASGNDAVFRIIRGAEVTASSSSDWSSVDSNSAVEVVKAGNISSYGSGGRAQTPLVVASGQGNSSGASEAQTVRRVPLSLTHDGQHDAESYFLLVAEGIGASADVYGTIEWEEIR